MSPGRERELLAECLRGVSGYQVRTLEPETGIQSLSYDICLLDSQSLQTCDDTLRQRKESSDSYLPHLLVLTDAGMDSSPGDRLNGCDAPGESLIDDVLTLPVAKDDVRRRVGNLLKRRRTSQQLTERESQYQELLDLTSEAILLVRDGRIRYANAVATEFFGIDAAKLRGERLDSYVDPGESHALATLLDSVPPLSEGSSESAAFTFIAGDGTELEAEVAGVRVHHGGEETIQLLVRDLTETNRREERLKLFGQAVEAAAHGIVIADARADDEPIIYANTGFSRITGYPLGEVLGRNCRFLQGENTASESVAELRAAIDAGEGTSVDLLNYRRDGTPFWNRVEIMPIRNEADELTHYLGLQRDITERVQNQQRLAVLDRILRHNVRNKTNVIRGYADAIVQGEAEFEDAATRIRNAADELLTISEQIREFDTVARVGEDATETVDLSAVIEEGVTALREESPTAEITVRTPGPLPITAHSTLRAALHDLLYQLGEGALPEAEIGVRRRDQDVHLEVIDKGAAISPSDLELVDSRSESPLEHLQGLELWLLRWAVEQSGGEFMAETHDDYPVIRMRFPASVETPSPSTPDLRDS